MRSILLIQLYFILFLYRFQGLSIGNDFLIYVCFIYVYLGDISVQ